MTGCFPADRSQFCQDGSFIDTIDGINWPPDGWDPCVGPWPPPAWGNVKQLMFSGAGTVAAPGNLFQHGWGQQGRCPQGSVQEGLWNAIVPKEGLLAMADGTSNPVPIPPFFYNPDVLPTSERYIYRHPTLIPICFVW